MAGWGFFQGNLPEGSHVQFLRILDRTWLPIHWLPTGAGRRPLLLNGWILRSFRVEGRPPDFGIVQEGSVHPIQASKVDYILRARRLPSIRLGLLRDPEHVYLDVSETWLPTQLYAHLAALSPRHELLRTEDGEFAFWQFRSADWPKVEAELEDYGLRPELSSIESWKQRKDAAEIPLAPVELVSNLLSELYSRYLKNEDRINYLRTDLALEAEKPFDSAELNSIWAKLREEAATNPTAALGIDFVRDFSHRMVDWKDAELQGLTPQLESIILSVEKTRFGGAYSGNYFRIYVPEFDTILHLSTTISPERHREGRADPARTFLRRLILARWRAYPYLGRVRNTGDAGSLSTQQLDPAIRTFIMTHLASLPSLEALVSDAGQFAAFNIDRNTWSEGHHPFSRTFVSPFEVKAPLDRYCSQPSIFARDVFGLPSQLIFDFEDFERRRGFIRSLQPGQWIEVILSDTLRGRQRTQTDRFEFQVEPFHKIEVISRQRAEEISALGIVKSYRSISDAGVELLDRAWSGVRPLKESLRSLRNSAHVIDCEDTWVYVPSQVTPQSVVKWEKLSRRGSVDDEERFRTTPDFARLSTHALSMDRAHPMFWLKHTELTRLAVGGTGSRVPLVIELANLEASQQRKDWTAQEELWKEAGGGTAPRIINVPRDADFRGLVKRACGVFRRFGSVSLRGAGAAVGPAYSVSKAVEHLCAFAYPRARVGGVWLASPGGFKVRAVEVTLLGHGGLTYGRS